MALGPAALAAIFLLIQFFAVLIVPIYRRDRPQLWGIPFFYWYQFACVIGGAVLTALAYVITTPAQRRASAAAALRSAGAVEPSPAEPPRTPPAPPPDGAGGRGDEPR